MLPILYKSLRWRNSMSKFLQTVDFTLLTNRGKKDDSNLSSLFVPVPIKPNPDDINIGAELSGQLNKADLLKVLNKFYQRKEIKQLCLENGLDSKFKM